MTNLKSRLLLVTLSAVALALGSTAHAQDATRSRRADPLRRPAVFSVSGTYSGLLGGQVGISGATYRLSESPQVFQLGVGPVPISSVPIGSLVYATGTGSAGDGTIRALIVRPAGDPAADPGAVSSKIREVSAAAPK